MATEQIRIALLWRQSSSYAAACFDALRAAGADVLLVERTATPDAPYVGDLGASRADYRWTDRPDEAVLTARLEAFSPHAMLVVSWDVGAYRRITRAWRGRALRVLCMDNSWLGTPKQWAGRVVSPLLIHPVYDAVFLPGERQVEFARRLGFSEDRILWGFYTCEGSFAGLRPPGALLPQRFLFVGRLVPEKGVDILAAAYRLYRERVPEPWPLLICGTGPLADRLEGCQGVEMAGFVQPHQLPSAHQRSGCLILPSRFEPWGVAIHEATSAGLAVVASAACGATTRLVLDGYNGLVVRPGSTAALAAAMKRISTLSSPALAAMGAASQRLAEQFTPTRWASYLIERVSALHAELGLAERSR